MMTFNKRDFDGMTPSIAHPDGKDAAGELAARLNDLRGTAVVALGSDTVAVAFDLAYDGRPAFAMSMTADATFIAVQTCEWDGSGNLTITGAANATAAVTVAYFVAGA